LIIMLATIATVVSIHIITIKPKHVGVVN
jgi:hypothetical protein